MLKRELLQAASLMSRTGSSKKKAGRQEGGGRGVWKKRKENNLGPVETRELEKRRGSTHSPSELEKTG